jgi:hypothetical protein
LAGDAYQGAIWYYEDYTSGGGTVYDGLLQLGYIDELGFSALGIWHHETGGTADSGWDPATGALNIDLGSVGRGRSRFYDETCPPPTDDVENPTEPPLSGETGTGSVECGFNDVADIWYLDLVAGETVVVGVDTAVAGDDPKLDFVGPDSCRIAERDDDVVCATGDTRCPSFQYTPEVSGRYSVVVTPWFCAGDAMEYTIWAVRAGG